ncbi:MAG: RNA polymerase sigma-H factor [Candidatus Poribacteria bacterium]|nr:MAG: RNA polymerase sigma-H factor [Candidatus Poribacteria bacterium]
MSVKDADQFLVEQFQSGDRGAFDALVQRHYRRIYDYAYYFTHDVEEAYDITQEVFLRAFKALNGFKGDSSFYTWLYKIATNACIDHRRRRRVYRRVALYEDLNVEAGLDRMPDRERLPDEQVLDLEIDEQIKQAVRQLPEKQRQVFILRHFEGLSLQEIADILNRELGTVKAHLFHATRKMRRLLAPYLEEVAVGGHEEG